MKCDKCHKEIEGRVFHVEIGDAVAYSEHNFCSRLCLIDGMAPELNQAVSVKQWIPTPEEEERMRQ